MRWRILALLFCGRVGLGLQFQTMGSVAGDITGIFGLSNADIGLLVGLFMAPGLVLAIPAGVLGRYGSDRLLASLGLGLGALGGAVSALAVGPDMIGLGRAIAGVGFLFGTLYLTKMVADWFDGREIATAMSIFVMSWPFGIAMGQIGHTWLADAVGWRAPFVVAALHCAVAALVVYGLYRRPDGAASPSGARVTGLALREWVLIGAAGTAWGLFNAGYVVYLSFGPRVLEAQGQAALAAASVISIASWVMIASGALCGRLTDRFGRPETIVAVCMIAAAASMALLTQPGAGLWASLLFGVIGMAPAGVIMAFAGQAVAPERRAFGMGVFLTIYYAALFTAPPAAGWLADQAGTASAALLLAGALFLMVLPALGVFAAVSRGAWFAGRPEVT